MDKKQIMIIDDQVDVARMMKDVLELEGYDVVLAPNGLEALEMLRKTIPALLILDMNMPKMGGIAFYHRLVQMGERPRYRILVLTAREELKGLFEELQVDGFMEKPFEMEALSREIKRILGEAA